MASPVTGIPPLNFGGTPYTLQPQDPYSQLFQALAPVLGGALDLGTAHLSMSDAERASGIADPFGGQRGQYQTQLNSYMGANPVNPAQATAGSNNALSMLTNLLQNPQSLTGMPGYQFGLNQALEGVNRGAGASGLLNSGNRLAALEDRGNSYAQSWQNQIFNQLLGNVGANNAVAQLGLGAQQQGYGQLANLAGVNAGSPVAAAQALLGGRQNQQNQLSGAIGGFANALPGALAAFNRIPGLSGSGGWNGATPGAANGQWDVDPSNVGGGSNGQWDFGGSGGWTDTIGDASGGLGGLEWLDTLGA